jgi:L-lactate dehydrogenase complex protein LldG
LYVITGPRMKEATSKEKILKRIRQALIYKTDYKFADIDLDTNVYAQSKEDTAIQFAQAFSDVNGKFIYSENEVASEMNLRSLLERYTRIFCLEKNVQRILGNAGIPFETNEARLHEIEVSVTSCEALVARTGSVIVGSNTNSGRRLSVYAPVHVVIAYTDQIFNEIKDALQNIRTKYNGTMPSMLSITTGPSRTSDIEKTLVLGAHGPKEMFVFLIEN